MSASGARGGARGGRGGARGARGSSSTSASLSRDFEQKLTIQPSAPPPVQAPAPVWAKPGGSSSTASSASVSVSASTAPGPVWAKPGGSSSTAPSVAVSVSAPTAPVQAVQQEVVSSTPSSTKAVRLPNRPGYGKAGRRCVVRANHFLVQVADRDLHHYDVSIDPEVTSKKVCCEIIAELVNKFRDSCLGKKLLAYDGRKSAYCAGPLPFASKDFIVKLPEKGGGARKEREFKVSIKFAAKPDINHLQQFLKGRQLDAPQETIQALDVVLRAKPSSCYETVGRSFFSPDLGAGKLTNGLEYWLGFYQSLRPTQMGLSLNIDMSARAFYEPVLVTQFVSKYYGDISRPLSDQDRVKIKKVLRGLRVQVDHRGYTRSYKVVGLSTQPLGKLTFPSDESGTTMSVVQYFREKYNIVLRYTSIPAIQAGSDAKPVMLPMELCRIVEGQRYTRKLNKAQVSAILKATCQRPDAREKSIHEMARKSNFNGDELVNKEFGIQVAPQLTTVEARVLPAPMLKYHESGRESRVDPRVGQWNMIDKKMVNGAKVEFWTCVCFSRDKVNVDKFCGELIGMCCSKGMDFNPAPLIPFNYANPAQIEKVLFEIQRQSAAKLHGKNYLQMLIIILPDITGSYEKIKRICETELGIVSQCCQPKQAIKCNKQYLENVALKINVKAGGRNTVLEHAIQRKIPFLTDRPTIVLGADVTHPAAGEDSSPSIAAVVGSMDWPEVTKYRGLVSAQPHREEIILDLYKEYKDPERGLVRGGMIRELLMSFRRSTGYKPDRIIFYRDGVSEGQFNQVLLFEMDAIRKACNSLEENYMPLVTFVVVQKRHHTRLFPERHGDRNSTDRSGNILPGTVVDTKICHPTEFDFYLNSHAGIQGTSRPAHYHVLYDENRFSADALQTLTNNLCYTYARCTRSVSIVPPAYYAHLAAFRARCYIEGDYSESESTHGGGKSTREKTAAVRPLPVIKDNVKNVMFYC